VNVIVDFALSSGKAQWQCTGKFCSLQDTDVSSQSQAALSDLPCSVWKKENE
jgi:hypothetical protein